MPNFAMEVRTISCSKKITAELAVNVDTIEYKTSSVHGNQEVFYVPFTISVGMDRITMENFYYGKIILPSCIVMSMMSNLWLEMYP